MVKPFEGILPVYKPAGFTSHDVVAKMRRIFENEAYRSHGHARSAGNRSSSVMPWASYTGGGVYAGASQGISGDTKAGTCYRH